MSRIMWAGSLAMAVVVVASNILVQYRFGDWLTWGAFTYPLAFLVTDVVNRLSGAAAARRVVVVGFAAGVACSLIASTLTGPDGAALTSLRIAIGSGAAFLAGQLLDVGLFNRLRAGSWWRAPFVASLAGSALDTVLFFAIAFSASFRWIDPGWDVAWAAEPLPLLGSGPVAPLWVSLAVADFLVKVALAIVALVPFRLILWRVFRGAGLPKNG